MEYILQKNNLQLIRYEADAWKILMQWVYDKRYVEMFRHTPRLPSSEDLKNYPALLGCEIFLAVDSAKYSENNENVVGYVYLSSCSKTNRGFKIGLLLDEDYQKQGYAPDMLYLALDYGFNRLGLRKGIADVLTSNTRLITHLLNSGFIQEGVFKEEAFIDGQYVDETRLVIFDRTFNELHKEKYRGARNGKSS